MTMSFNDKKIPDRFFTDTYGKSTPVISPRGHFSEYDFSFSDGLVLNYKMNDEYLSSDIPKMTIKSLLS